jgi:hypothetical protein
MTSPNVQPRAAQGRSLLETAKAQINLISAGFRI